MRWITKEVENFRKCSSLSRGRGGGGEGGGGGVLRDVKGGRPHPTRTGLSIESWQVRDPSSCGDESCVSWHSRIIFMVFSRGHHDSRGSRLFRQSDVSHPKPLSRCPIWNHTARHLITTGLVFNRKHSFNTRQRVSNVFETWIHFPFSEKYKWFRGFDSPFSFRKGGKMVCLARKQWRNQSGPVEGER